MYGLMDSGCGHVLRHVTIVVICVDGTVSVIDDCGDVVILCGDCFPVVFIDTVQQWCQDQRNQGHKRHQEQQGHQRHQGHEGHHKYPETPGTPRR